MLFETNYRLRDYKYFHLGNVFVKFYTNDFEFPLFLNVLSYVIL